MIPGFDIPACGFQGQCDSLHPVPLSPWTCTRARMCLETQFCKGAPQLVPWVPDARCFLILGYQGAPRDYTSCSLPSYTTATVQNKTLCLVWSGVTHSDLKVIFSCGADFLRVPPIPNSTHLVISLCLAPQTPWLLKELSQTLTVNKPSTSLHSISHLKKHSCDLCVP